MHQFFTLPELIATVLATDAVDDSLLASCLLVNRLFSHETIRVLWDWCGSNVPVGHQRRRRNPTVRHLAEITARDLQRGQYYATFIRRLYFARGISGEDWPDSCDGDAEQQWHMPLMALHFPSLEHFSSDVIDMPTHYRDGDYPFVVKSGVFYDFHFPHRESEGLFWRVVHNSPRLRTLNLVFEEPGASFGGALVEDEAVRLAESTPALSSLVLAPSRNNNPFPKYWPPQVLDALARHPNLSTLKGLFITSERLSALPVGAFPALTELSVIYSGLFDTQQFVSIFPLLSYLELEILKPSSHILRGIDNLASLTSLFIEMAEGSTISNSELLAIAHGCPLLQEVGLPPAHVMMMEEPLPEGDGITDATMEAFLRALPQLDTFCFGLENRWALTHESLISLARHCPKAGYVYLAANICVPNMIRGLQALSKESGRSSSEAPLSNAIFLRLMLCEDDQHEYSNAEELASVFSLHFATSLSEFSISDGSANDTVFAECVEGMTRR